MPCWSNYAKLELAASLQVAMLARLYVLMISYCWRLPSASDKWRKLLICDTFSAEYNVSFNVNKTKCLHFRPSSYVPGKKSPLPSFSLGGNIKENFCQCHAHILAMWLRNVQITLILLKGKIALSVRFTMCYVFLPNLIRSLTVDCLLHIAPVFTARSCGTWIIVR